MTTPLLLETICCQNGQLQALPYHEGRIQQSQVALFGESRSLQLSELTVPRGAQRGRFKCRLLYRLQIEAIQFLPYRIRSVHSLRLINADALHYALKYADRSHLQACFEQRGEADDILLVKNGLITDSYYANVAFWDGQAWFTPAHPLLPGTRRAQLLDRGRVRLADIRPQDIEQYEYATLFNAMMDLGEGPVVTQFLR